jgi:hypothetical protein
MFIFEQIKQTMPPKELELRHRKNPIKLLQGQDLKHYMYKLGKAILEDRVTITYKHTK